MSTLSVVIPAMNEEEGIERIIRRVLSIEPRLPAVGIEKLELIVVDDGSKDRTAEIVASFPQVTLVQHEVNHGYGAAIKTGFCRACGDWLAFLDADGTYPPEHLPDLCQAALEQDADLVIGSRMAGTESRMPRTRRVGNKLFAGLLSVIANARITDSASGMRVLRRSALDMLYPLPDGLHFTPAMSTRAIHEPIKMIEVPIPYEERMGRSKLSAVRDGFRFLRVIMATALSYNPVRILGLTGFAGVAIAAVIGLALLIARLQGVTTLGAWGVFGVFVAMVAAVAGVGVFGLGATFNYLVSLFQKRPVRQGLFGKPIFKTPLDHYFGWLGGASGLAGVVLAVVSLILGLNGWDISRLWLYLLGSAMLFLMGTQFVLFWLVMRILEDLSRRDAMVLEDQVASQ